MAISLVPLTHDYSIPLTDCDILVLAAGFEDRAYRFVTASSFNASTICVLIRFVNDIPDNEEVYSKFKSKISESFSTNNIYKIELQKKALQRFERNLDLVFKDLPRIAGKVWIDVSGMPSHVICSSLRICRSRYPDKEIVVIYTSADHYFPTKKEYIHLKEKQSEGVEFLPKGMAEEMSEVLLLESFTGHRSKNGVTCLAIFAGYDVHRSAGIIESINPSTLLILYGDPGDESLKWRHDLSRQLHHRFETTRKTATETVSTLNPDESLRILEQYYDYLIEDYDLTISPTCSKMQAVCAYLFWERHREIQLAFALPIGYATDRRPTGIGHTYKSILEPRNSLYRGIGI